MTKGKGWPSSQVIAQVVRATGTDPGYLLFGKERVIVTPQIVAILGEVRARLDELEARLKAATKAIPLNAKQDARAAAETIDLGDRVAQIREGAPPSLPRGERRRKPRRIQGNRGG